MKTILSPKFFLMIASASFIMASCKKDTLPQAKGNVGTDPNANLATATIQDVGPVDDSHRLMMATITNQNIILSNSTDETPGTAAEINFSFYSDADGVIPTGTYSFSASGSLQPFTFTAGMLKSANISGDNEALNLPVTGGTIYVTQNGSNYALSFVCNLASGDVLNGRYSGNAMYEDASVKK